MVKQSADLAALLEELEARKNEALSIYRPMAGQQFDFHRCFATERLIRGGNRSGKTMSAAVEVASAATGRPVIGPDGNPVAQKYPTDRPLTIWVVGLGEKHIGATFYRMLFEPGAFKIIKDRKTGLMRAWRPWEQDDLLRESQTQQAPPLIPPRLVKEIVWTKRGTKQFELIRLSNGTEIHAYVSTGEVKQGDPVDLIWIDERVQYPQYLPEWQARLSDRKGRLIWSTWPEAGNKAIRDMSKRATEDKDLAKPDVAEFRLTFSANPYIDEDEKRKRIKGWSRDPKERQARDLGEFVDAGTLIFPEFNEHVHACPWPLLAGDKFQLALQANNFQPPKDWTRYLIIDPGVQRFACGFFAVPPPEDFGDHVVMYDELYMRAPSMKDITDAIYARINGYSVEKFIIDHKYSAQRITGHGEKTYRQYFSEAFYERGLNSVQTGNSFQYSASDVKAGLMAVHGWFGIRRDGTPRFRVVSHMCPNFLAEIATYVATMKGDKAEETPATGQEDHLMDVLRYAAADGLPYAPVVNDPIVDPGPHYRSYQDWWTKGPQQQSTNSAGAWSFGPGALSSTN